MERDSIAVVALEVSKILDMNTEEVRVEVGQVDGYDLLLRAQGGPDEMLVRDT